MGKYEIWCKSTYGDENKMFWCMTIYQKWDEDDLPFRRRAKRKFKQYQEKNKAEHRTFYLLQDNE